MTRTCLSLSARHLDGGTVQAAAGNGFTNSELGKPLAHGAAVGAIITDEETFDECIDDCFTHSRGSNILLAIMCSLNSL